MDPLPVTVNEPDCEDDNPVVLSHTYCAPEPPETGDIHENEWVVPSCQVKLIGNCEYVYGLPSTVSTVPLALELIPVCANVTVAYIGLNVAASVMLDHMYTENV